MTIAMLLLLLFSPIQVGGQAAQRPVDERGAHAMGFDQDKTTHHFLLYQDGGAIDVAVKDPADSANRDAIRMHLPHITMLFGQGNFDLPHFIHGTNVPGTAAMKRFKEQITYRYQETARGGRVDIVTSHADALKAIHGFLRFQIADHKTGDSVDVKKRPAGGNGGVVRSTATGISGSNSDGRP